MRSSISAVVPLDLSASLGRSLRNGIFISIESMISNIPKIEIKNNMCWALIFVLIFIFYFTTYYVPQSPNQIAGDGICNIAYWYSLFDSSLRGSMGAAGTKPGWAILLGLSHGFYNLSGGSYLLLKTVLVFFAAFLVWIMARVATGMGGWQAGGIVFLYALCDDVIFNWYKAGHSYLFCVPLIMAGLWLYREGKERLGVAFLVASIYFRIESAIVLVLVSGIEITRRRYRKALLNLAVLALSVLAWVSFVYIVQGDLTRLDSGIGAGYASFNKAKYYLNIPSSLLFYGQAWKRYYSNAHLEYILFILALLVTTFCRKERVFFAFTGVFIGQYLNILLLGGSNYYVMMIRPFNIALGFGGLFYFLKRARLPQKAIPFIYIFLYSLIAVFMFKEGRIENFKKNFISIRKIPLEYLIERAPFITNALDIVKRKIVPPGSAILTEDDIISSLAVNAPLGYFGKMYALPYLNMCDDRKRQAILEHTDFMYISKLWHQTFFLNHPGPVQWKEDIFREQVLRLLKGKRPFSMYNVTFQLIEESNLGYLIKVGRIKD